MEPMFLLVLLMRKLKHLDHIVDGMMFTVKNKPYSLVDLLGSEERAKRYAEWTVYCVLFKSS